MSAEDGKRSEVMSFRATERVALDILRAASRDDRSPGDWLYRLVRLHLYGHLRQAEENEQAPDVHKVDKNNL